MQMSNGIPFVQMFLALMLEEVVPILMLPNHGVRELTGIQSKVHCRFHLTDDGIQHFTGMKQVAYVAPEAVVKAQSPDARIAHPAPVRRHHRYPQAHPPYPWGLLL